MANVSGCLIVTTFLVTVTSVGLNSGFLPWNKEKGQNLCSRNSARLLSLLNILCNNTQNSTTTRDACYGCFFRAGGLPAGPLQLTSLSQCSTMYLTNTGYASCATRLAMVASGVVPTAAPTLGVCYAGYCEFVRCLRRINSNVLIARCYNESLPNTLLNDADHIRLYTNITSCILAMARCNPFNPITGEMQPSLRVNQFLGKPVSISPVSVYNSLQITPGGDLRIVAFPASTSVADYFCSTRSSLDQSGWSTVPCTF